MEASDGLQNAQVTNFFLGYDILIFLVFDVYINITSGSLVCAMIIKAVDILAMRSIGTQSSLCFHMMFSVPYFL